LQNKKASVFVRCPNVKPIDTTGAGDIFGGSAVCRVLKTGKKPEDLDEAELTETAKFAVTAASLSTQKSGGIPSVPDESEVIDVIEN
jgi:sugar/nucleoside kinase (ribokinase family)